jgi:hypothetical protein
MPNCFQLLRKTDGEAEALAVVDEVICKALGVEVHPTKYALGWFDVIGLGFAIGQTAAGQRDWHYHEAEHDLEFKEYNLALAEICILLEERYTVRSWATR